MSFCAPPPDWGSSGGGRWSQALLDGGYGHIPDFWLFGCFLLPNSPFFLIFFFLTDPLWFLWLHLSPKNPLWVTSGLDLVVVSAAFGKSPAAQLLRQRIHRLAGSFPACFAFLFSLFFFFPHLISSNQALVTQVMVSAPCEDAFHYASSLAPCPQLIRGLTARAGE